MAGISPINILNNVLKSLANSTPIDNAGVDTNITALKVQGNVMTLMKNFIITPNVILSESLKYMDEGDLKSIIKKEISVFGAIVVDAIRILANVYGLQPSVALGIVNDRRSLPIVGNEAYDYWKDLAENDFLFVNGYEANSRTDKDELTKMESKPVDITKDINIATTKFEVQLTVNPRNGNKKVIVIPIFVQPRVFTVNSKNLIDSLVDNTVEKSFSYRWDEWRSGAISFLDFILATDLVKEYKEKRLKSDSDVAKLIKNKTSSNTVKALLTGKVRFDANYNIYNFDVNEKVLLDKAVQGDIYKTKYMKTLLSELHAFSVTLIDQNKQRIVYLTELNTKPSVMPIKFIKNEKTQESLSDIIANLTAGRPPF